MIKMINILLIGLVFVSIFSFVSAVGIYGDADARVTSENDDSASVESNNEVRVNDGGREEGEVRINAVSDKQREFIMDRVSVRTGLDVTVDENASVGQNLRVYLSNGRYAYIRVFPESASLVARARLNASCEENNCSIELKERKVNGDVRAAYEVRMEKRAKILGFMETKMNVRADVDAETGEVIRVHRPWWSFMAKEEASVDVETE